MTVSTIPDTESTCDVTSSRSIVNPYAVVGVVALFLREEGVIPNGTPYTEESSRRRVELARQLLAEFGVDALTAAERAQRHAEAKVATR